jgi:surface antigen
MYPEERSLVKEMQGRPFVLLGVNTDRQRSTAQNAVKENRLNWRSFFDGKSRRITGLFKIRAFPTVMVIDHTGRIAWPNLRGKKLHSEIKRLVQAAEADGMQGDRIAPEWRTFRDRTGDYRIEAIAEAKSQDQVRLRKRDGGTVTLSVSDLSRRDRDYLETADLPALESAASETSDSPAAADRPFRTFVDATGQYRVEAAFVKCEGNEVTLRKRDGSTTTVLLDRLSEEDQAWVKRQTDDF